MRKLLSAASAALIGVGAMCATAAPAGAADWHGHDSAWHGGYHGYYGGWRGGHGHGGDDWVWGLGAGLAGFALGAAVASPYYGGYYGYPGYYGYGGPYYGGPYYGGYYPGYYGYGQCVGTRRYWDGYYGRWVVQRYYYAC
jgi:hypothetical protein